MRRGVEPQGYYPHLLKFSQMINTEVLNVTKIIN
jgi:hypothetical protein